MDYVKLSPKAEKCMRVNEIIKDVILLAAALAADFVILWQRSHTACLLTGAVLLVLAAEENLEADIGPDIVPESIAESGNVFSYGAWDMARKRSASEVRPS